MEEIKVLIVTDNKEGKRITKGFHELGTEVHEGDSLKALGSFSEISAESLVLLIVHLNKMDLDKFITELKKIEASESWLKFIFVKRGHFKSVEQGNFNMLHLEFLRRPVRMAEFFLLMEKSIIAERFKIMLRDSSIVMKERGEGFQYLFDLFRKKLFAEKKESGEVFDKILKLQSRINDENRRAEQAIEKFSHLKVNSLFIDEPVLIEDLLEPLMPFDNKDRALATLRESNVDLEDALIASQMKIIELETKLQEKNKLLEANSNQK